MKKILGIFLIAVLLFSYPIQGYIYAEDSTVQEEIEDTTAEESTSLNETLDETEDTSSISWWIILLSVLGISLFIAVVYYVLKNFNIGTGK